MKGETRYEAEMQISMLSIIKLYLGMVPLLVMANGSYSTNWIVYKNINFGQITKNKCLKAREIDKNQAETGRGVFIFRRREWQKLTQVWVSCFYCFSLRAGSSQLQGLRDLKNYRPDFRATTGGVKWGRK